MIDELFAKFEGAFAENTITSLLGKICAGSLRR